jgi:RHS repeat-associated protein
MDRVRRPSSTVLAAALFGCVLGACSGETPFVDPGAGANADASANHDGASTADMSPLAVDAGDGGSSSDAGENDGARDGMSTPETFELGAPALPVSRSTTFADSVAFLYEGATPVQRDVDVEALDERRISVVRGRVVDAEGLPFEGVMVRLLDHDELGWTTTREDGRYDLVVNAGGPLVVQVESESHLPIQRTVETSWGEFVEVPEVALTELDDTMTFVSLATMDRMTAARGSVVEDDDGRRQGTLLFSPDTHATYTRRDGTTADLSSLSVRITEYTQGERGVEAMPGSLPPLSGYTYAMELSVDEVLDDGVKVDGKDVLFDQPVRFYLDNFLGFDAGTVVPVGYYDAARAAWIPYQDGRVIELLPDANADGSLEVDVDGSGTAATPERLAELAISDEERAELTALYPAGTTLWRVMLDHFSTWDCNLAIVPPSGNNLPPTGSGPKFSDRGATPDDPCAKKGSIIECETQSLGERVELAGTPAFLAYKSSRTPARGLAGLSIDVTGAVLPAAIVGARYSIDIAGNLQEALLDPEASMTVRVPWDGTDGYGRPVRRTVTTLARVGYVYPASYATVSEGALTNAFARFGVDALPQLTRDELVYWRSFVVSVGAWTPPKQALGGWTFSMHHAFEPSGMLLHYGDGTERRVDELIHRYAGGRSPTDEAEGGGVAGLPADVVRWTNLSEVFAGPDGAVYVGHLDGVDRIANGVSTAIAGFRTNTSWEREGRLATAIDFHRPSGLALDDAGGLYVLEREADRLSYVRPDGTVTMIITEKDRTEPLGDGGPAIDARILGPVGLGRMADGTLFFGEQGTSFVGEPANPPRIRMVTPDGIIATVAGGGTDSGEGVYGTEARITQLQDVAVAPDGSVYFSERGTDRVRRLGLDGYVRTVAGGGTLVGDAADGGLATAARLSRPDEIHVGTDGTLYILERDGLRLWAVDVDGTIHTVAGNGERHNSSRRGPVKASDRASLFSFNAGAGLTTGPNGTVYVTDGDQNAVYRLTRLVPGTMATYLVPNEDGTEVYVFDGEGVHLETRNAFTGALVYGFEYLEIGLEKLLDRVIDAHGAELRIERDASGDPVAVVAPGGQRTELTTGSDGYLASVRAPHGGTYAFTYGTGNADGLLLTKTSPSGGVSRFEYDDEARLVRDEGPDGRVVTLAREETADSVSVEFVDGAGRATTYSAALEGDRTATRSTTGATGDVTTVRVATEGVRAATYPDGTTVTITPTYYEHLGSLAWYPGAIAIETPAGKTLAIETTVDVELADADDPFSITSTSVESRVNGGAAYLEVFDAATRAKTHTTPTGRVQVTTFDDNARLASFSADGLATLDVSWTSGGQLEGATQGSWSRVHSYDGAGNRASVTVGGEVATFRYDSAGRLSSSTMPSGEAWSFTYDGTDRNTGVTMPSGAAHVFTYTSGGRMSGYAPPSSSRAVTFAYDADDKLASVLLPASGLVTYGYDSVGRLASIDSTSGEVAYEYAGSTSRPSLVSWSGPGGTRAQSIATAYDGFLQTSQTWSGDASATFAYGYDANLNRSSVRFESGATTLTTAMTYDADELLASVDTFAFTREGPDGIVDTVSDGTATWTHDFDENGVWTGVSLRIGSSDVYAWERSLAASGRAESQTETLTSTEVSRLYAYDADGRLSSVMRNGTSSESYVYDDNGNRTSSTLSGTSMSYAYDADDAITSAGSASALVDADGRLVTLGTATFTYAARGELLSANVDGTTIDYGYDGMKRRVYRREGAAIQRYFYGEPGRPFRLTHSMDESNIATRYLYDDRGHLIAFDRGPTRYYVATDALGSPRAVFSAAGAVVRAIERDSFGRVLSDTDPSLELPVGFAGGLEDESAGLVRFGLRDYVPSLGRFATRDPLLLGTPQIHPYLYVGADPVNLRDPTGLASIGFSAYAGLGGGVKLGFGDGHASLCFEVGFGVGAGVSVSPIEGADRSGDNIVAAAGASCGPIGLGAEIKLTDCGTLETKGSFGVGPLGSETSATYADGEWSVSGGNVTVGGEPGDLGSSLLDVALPEGEWKCKPQAKIAAESCRRLW